MIVVVPEATPYTVPLDGSTVPFATALLLQVPPAVASLSVIVEPTHTDPGVPMIALIGFTVTVVLLLQPVAVIIYDIVLVPAVDPPVTIPDVPTVATPVLVLLQVPPPVPSARFVVAPWHTVAVPVIAAIGLTVTTVFALQPEAVIYVIVVVPDATPYTVPLDAPTVPFATVLLLHVPPDVVSLSVTVDPTHTVAGTPRIAEIGLTVTL